MDDKQNSVSETENRTQDMQSSEETQKIDIEEFRSALEKEIIERVRKEEKDKLYQTIEKLKSEIKNSEEARKLAEAKLKEYEQSNLSAAEQAALKLKELEESNRHLQEQLHSVIEQANSKITSLQLDLFKKDVIKQYGDEIFEDLVTGSSEEEILASAKMSHEKYINFREKEIAKFRELNKISGPIGTSIKPSSESFNSSISLEDIRNVNSKEDWDKLKPKLLKELFKV